MQVTVFVCAVIISLVLLYTMREVRLCLVKISEDIQDLKNASNKS